MHSEMENMSVLKRTVKHYLKLFRYRSNGWHFSSTRRGTYLDENEDWLELYLPINVTGLTVLDVGAGEGESARFFLEHGAKKVVCIEPDKACFRLLLENSIGRSLDCYNKAFSPSDLNLSFDFMKMDIEGWEEELLKLHVEKPSVIEIHGLQLREKFEKAGYQIITKDEYGWISYAYKGLEHIKLIPRGDK